MAKKFDELRSKMSPESQARVEVKAKEILAKMSRNEGIQLGLLATIECNHIIDWQSFHDEFNRVFQFPSFYGRNMNAWVDCMTSLDDPEDELTYIHCEAGSVMTLALKDVKSFIARCPEQYAAIVECSAFVNWRRIERGLPAVLALSFYA